MSDIFITQKPKNQTIANFVDSYFYIDKSREDFLKSSFVFPYPRITIGYFFEYPFWVENIEGQGYKVECVVSRLSMQGSIIVKPIKERVRILGAHMKPFALAYFTQKPVNLLPRVINLSEFLPDSFNIFKQKISQCNNISEYFDVAEKAFLLMKIK